MVLPDRSYCLRSKRGGGLDYRTLEPVPMWARHALLGALLFLLTLVILLTLQVRHQEQTLTVISNRQLEVIETIIGNQERMLENQTVLLERTNNGVGGERDD